ncbi:MAG: response regulator [Promethearchaeota archaeon]
MEKKKIKIFIIEDEQTILDLYSKFFSLKGFDVVGTAKNGIEALKQLKNSTLRPDIFLIDYHMPYLNGIEISKLILNIDSSFKIIMMSGNTSIKKKALSIGILDFFDKSLDLTKLYIKVKEIFDLSKN